MSGKLRDDSTVELAATTDVANLGLNQREGFLISRIAGRKQSVADLLKVSGMLADDARTIISRLALRGVVEVKHKAGGPVVDDDDDPYAGMVFSPAIIHEDVELTLEQKKRILFVEANLNKWNHYGLLGLKRTATGSAIKKGYFRASKEFHPDSFFRKELGTYKARVHQIFRAMKVAYDVLRDDKKRARYDDTVEVGLTLEEERELRDLARLHAEKKAAAARDERLAERKKQRRIARNPMLDRIKRGRDMLRLAEEAMTAKNFGAAGRHAQLARDYAKTDAALLTRAGEIVAESRKEKARQMASRVDAYIASYDDDKLLSLVDEMEQLAPDDATVLSKAARVAASARQVARAVHLLRKACEVDNDEKSLREQLYRYATAHESWHTALKAAEWLVAKEPKNSDYKTQLKDARRQAKA